MNTKEANFRLVSGRLSLGRHPPVPYFFQRSFRVILLVNSTLLGHNCIRMPPNRSPQSIKQCQWSKSSSRLLFSTTTMNMLSCSFAYRLFTTAPTPKRSCQNTQNWQSNNPTTKQQQKKIWIPVPKATRRKKHLLIPAVNRKLSRRSTIWNKNFVEKIPGYKTNAINRLLSNTKSLKEAVKDQHSQQ